MPVPYDDKEYLAAVEAINHAAAVIADMEGSDIGTVEDIFDQAIDNLREELAEDDTEDDEDEDDDAEDDD